MVISVKFHRKYKVKYLENKQKIRKNAFFHKKKLRKALFCTLKEIFLVILQPKKADNASIILPDSK